jgi:hypothetical protein
LVEVAVLPLQPLAWLPGLPHHWGDGVLLGLFAKDQTGNSLEVCGAYTGVWTSIVIEEHNSEIFYVGRHWRQ